MRHIIQRDWEIADGQHFPLSLSVSALYIQIGEGMRHHFLMYVRSDDGDIQIGVGIGGHHSLEGVFHRGGLLGIIL